MLVAMVVVVRAGLEEDEEGTGDGGGESKAGREEAEEAGDGFVIPPFVCLGWCLWYVYGVFEVVWVREWGCLGLMEASMDR